MARHSLFAVTTILAVAAASVPFTIDRAGAEDAGRTIAQKAGGSDRYLRDSGAVRLPSERRSDGRRGGEANTGDSQARRVNGIDRLTGSANSNDALQEFDEDNLNTAPDIYSTSEREEFLEDGGSISSSPFNGDGPSAVSRGGIRPLRGPAAGHWRHVVVQPVDISTRGSVSFLTADVGYERGNRGSYQYQAGRGEMSGGSVQALPSTPKIIDVETARLDRRPMPSSGIETIWSGGAKIIRIAKDYRRSDETASLK